MITRELTRDLFSHMEWADARIWDTALKLDAAREDEVARAVLVHMHSAQQAFLDAWHGQAPTFRKPSDFSQLESLYAYATSYYAPARAFLETIDEGRFSEPLVLPWVGFIEERMGRPVAETTIGETIVQVFSHTTHHRAQVSARLRLLGGEPPIVDYIAWIWFGRPQPEWPAAPVR